MRKTSHYKLIMIAMKVAAVIFLQGCYVKYKDKVIIGDEDVSLPDAKIESGCVKEVTPGTLWYPPEPSDVRFKGPDGGEFKRYVPFGEEVEVGKCYQWKLKLGNPMTPWWPEVNEQTLLEVELK